MDEIRHFVPGDGGRDLDAEFLPRLRWPVATGVGGTYVHAYARPGERVLVPYCQGPDLVREILDAGRVPLALNFDPLLVLLGQVALNPPPPRELDAAVARLGDSLKRGVPLRRYLGDLYATTCPACLRPAVADYFIWDRDLAEPVAKYVRCPACAWDGRTAVDVEDRERLAGVEPRGMHYHYLLDRIAPEGGGGLPRPRLEQLLELYSARNLYALAELTIKIDSLFAPGPLRRALDLLLADCLDRCSSLAPLPNSSRRRERLRLARPSRYLERNAWLAFEDAAARLRSLVAAGPTPGLAADLDDVTPAGAPAGVGRPESTGEPESPGVAEASVDPRPAGVLAHGLVRDLPRSVPPRSLGLVLSSPPPLDPAAWALSYLWGAWALGAGAVTSLLPLLRQRGADPAWYARVMAGSLATLSDLLRDDGRIVLVLTEQSTAVVEALLLAAAGARLGLAVLAQRGADYRLELAPAVAPVVAPSGAPLEEPIRDTALDAARDALRARGEPAGGRLLHAAAYTRLARGGLLRRALDDRGNGLPALDLVAAEVEQVLEDPALTRLAPGGGTEEALYWLANPVGVDAPLSDRVEARAHQILQEAAGRPLSEAEFTRQLYAAFPGPLAPDRNLVAACLRAYGEPSASDGWVLRPEDVLAAREAERRDIVAQLLALGRRLGYHTLPRPPFDVAWLEEAAVRGLFLVRWRAEVSRLPTPEQGRPYLVIPGGRAALVSLKLAHNPLWQRTVEGAGWRFIKYRHVRQLAAQEEVDEYQLRTIVGLDPIVERESAQIPLF
ncbi:MAG: hypothetical protein P8129_15560 [Anaerolineae bacterium]